MIVAIFLYSVGILVAFAFQFWIAALTMEIQTSKGYKKKFWVGFIFGPLAWLYYAAMPDLKMRELLEEKAKTNKKE